VSHLEEETIFRKNLPRPPKPKSRQAIVDWFQREELPRGTGLDPKTRIVAPWFHGQILFLLSIYMPLNLMNDYVRYEEFLCYQLEYRIYIVKILYWMQKNGKVTP
jgi:hypothetical protein